MVDEIPIPAKDTNLVQYEIGSTTVNFYRPLTEFQPFSSVF